MEEYKISKDEENIRIDKLISEVKNDLSRASIQRMIDNGNILVNNKKVKVSYKLAEGDLITIEEEEPIEVDLIPQNIPIDIIYEDNDMLIINKEKGMVVHPGARKSRWNSC